MQYYKFVHPEGNYGVIYHNGINVDPKPFKPEGNCKKGGLYFAKEDILAYCYIGPMVYRVKPIGKVYDDHNLFQKYKANSIDIEFVGNWHENPEVIKELIKDGAKPNIDNFCVFKFACLYNNQPLVKYLLDEYKVDINKYPDVISHLVYMRNSSLLNLLSEYGLSYDHDQVRFIQNLMSRFDL